MLQPARGDREREEKSGNTVRFFFIAFIARKFPHVLFML